MTWAQRVRFLSWMCFALMLVAIFWFIFVSDDAESIMDIRLVPFLVFLFLYGVLQLGAVVIDRREKEYIRNNGIPAKATVISTGQALNVTGSDPLMTITLEVHPLYEPRFTTTIEQVVVASDLKKVQPGSRVKVLYIEGTTKVALAEIGQEFP